MTTPADPQRPALTGFLVSEAPATRCKSVVVNVIEEDTEHVRDLVGQLHEPPWLCLRGHVKASICQVNHFFSRAISSLF
jgi:hypothetical protein